MRATRSIPLITGPTAVGKTRIAIDLAARLHAEIVSVDSRQVYRELGVAVDKPSPTDRERVRHHLVDSHSVFEPLSAGSFAREAEARIQDIVDRGTVPVVSGGSTLYLQALIEGLADIPPVPTEVRLRTRNRLRALGSHALYSELQEVDPVFAATLDPTKSQRIVRGIEVYEATGAPLSSFFGSSRPAYSYDIVILERERAALYRRIDDRVTGMVGAGLVAETRDLLASGFDPNANPTRTIGYPEAAAFLRGDVDQETMIETIRRNTRRYAKRQITFLRRFEGAIRLQIDDGNHEAVVDGLVERFADSATR